MKVLKNLFDYIFYRTACLDKKQDGNISASHMPVTFIQILLFIIVIFGIIVAMGYRSLLKNNLQFVQYSVLVIMVILGIFNYIKYRNKFEDFHAKWKGENKTKRTIRGFLIVLLHIILIGLMMSLAYIGK